LTNRQTILIIPQAVAASFKKRDIQALQHVPGLGLIATSIRTLAPLRLYRPATPEQIAHIFQNEEFPPMIVAGGTDLCAKFNDGAAPRSLVALDRAPALRRIEHEGGELRIGCAVTHAAGSRDPLVNQHLGGLARAWGAIANARIRFRATIGGNIMALQPRYEMSIILAALDTALSFRVGDRSVRISVDEAWSGKVPPRSFLEYIAVPLGHDAVTFRYDRSLRPIMTLAFSVRSNDDGITPRAVVATELLAPTALRFPTVSSPQDLRAPSLASSAAASLPADYADGNTTNWYLRRAVAALLQRNIGEITRV
jgi:aerobic carbon-monoxide dehydrogenase medium subunit